MRREQTVDGSRPRERRVAASPQFVQAAPPASPRRPVRYASGRSRDESRRRRGVDATPSARDVRRVSPATLRYVRTADVKDQIELTGNDVGAVSLTASQIRQSCNITKKDLRKFLDGIFVSWKGPTPEPV